MSKSNNKFLEAVIVVEIHKLLKECIDFDNIENADFIYKNLNLVNGYKIALPDEICKPLDMFIKETIEPIIEDEDYFSFIHGEEFGTYNDEGIFAINSEHSAKMMIVLLCKHTIELDEKLDKFASEYLYQKVAH
ncbi:MAG: hypothetical protein NC213_04085 [Acetobacter sp.]|nr:hypothetical protein [Bacteroides sp.]MCM1340903.1 hypothetical protein [Acetobacter sp.]MCM1432541.1 hypothetical protein [Clostridiales bacterium]